MTTEGGRRIREGGGKGDDTVTRRRGDERKNAKQETTRRPFVSQYFVSTFPKRQIRSLRRCSPLEMVMDGFASCNMTIFLKVCAPQGAVARVFGAGKRRGCSATKGVVRGKVKRAGARV
jgi:hypothetical protein